MSSHHFTAGLSVAAALAVPFGALAENPSKADEHAGHHPDSAVSAPAQSAAIEGKMEAMRQMHEKMMNAKTPEERQALMQDHMKAMQGGMQMMRGMSGMGGTGGMGTKSTHKPPVNMARRQVLMEQRMDMMQMMMDMMMQRMPDSALPAGK